jgi:hypothetical protein
LAEVTRACSARNREMKDLTRITALLNPACPVPSAGFTRLGELGGGWTASNRRLRRRSAGPIAPATLPSQPRGPALPSSTSGADFQVADAVSLEFTTTPTPMTLSITGDCVDAGAMFHVKRVLNRCASGGLCLTRTDRGGDRMPSSRPGGLRAASSDDLRCRRARLHDAKSGHRRCPSPQNRPDREAPGTSEGCGAGRWVSSDKLCTSLEWQRNQHQPHGFNAPQSLRTQRHRRSARIVGIVS